LRYLSSDVKNTVFGLVRNPGMTKTRLARDSIKNIHILEADMADNTSLTIADTAMSPITTGALDYLIINGA